MTAEPISVEAMCEHARQSCRVNGLWPVAFHYGRDVEQMLKAQCFMPMDAEFVPLPSGILFYHNGLPVYRMKHDGVACIGRRAHPLLGIKPFGQQ